MRTGWKLLGVGVVSAAAGAAVGYFVTKKVLDELYETRLAEEVQTSIDFLIQQGVSLEKVDVVVDVEDLADDEVPEPELEEKEVAGERVFGDAYKSDLSAVADAALKNQQVRYDKVLTTEEYTEEDKSEFPDPPEEDPEISVISKDIFLENATEWPQSTLTYFSDAGVLDDMGEFVADHVTLIGQGPYPFGFMSEDPEVVYIRNKRLEQEFEVLKDEGKAADFLAHSLKDMYSRPD